MKKALVLIPIVTLLAACGTTKDAYERRADAERQRQEKNVARSLDQAPEWMIKPPISNSAVYSAGTASSGDFSMAVHKAKADAYGKICMSAGGTANQRSRMYKSDTANTSSEISELVISTKCQEIDLTGVETADKKIVQEGNRYRAYVLIVLPTGDANVLKKAKEQQAADRNAAIRAEKAFNEIEGGAQQPTKAVAPVDQLGLIEVDNEAYKKKRAEALQKPGAVYGRMTVPM